MLSDRIDDLLTGSDGAPNAHLEPVQRLLIASEHHPHGLIAWLDRSGVAQLLRQLASREEAITYDVLDTFPQNHANTFLRAVLVEAGILPARNDDLERVRPWLEAVLVNQPDHQVRLIRPFVHWFLLRRARRAAARRRYETNASRLVRARVRVALEFLAWLDDLHLDLATLDQQTVDRWLTEGSSRRREIRSFLAWARSHRLTKELRVPFPPRQQPEAMLEERERWRLLERCFNDTTQPLDTRAAGALILLYGLPLIRIRSLTADHLDHHSGERTHLVVGAHRLLLPPKLALMLNRLAEAGFGRSRYPTRSGARRWLFMLRWQGK